MSEANEWNNIESCPQNRIVHLVDHETYNVAYIGYQQDGIFLLRKGDAWTAMDHRPTHWARIRTADPPVVIKVGSYKIRRVESEEQFEKEYCLNLYENSESTTWLSRIASSNRAYLELIGEWAFNQPWTKVVEVVRRTQVMGEEE